jgi:hypothetical protein
MIAPGCWIWDHESTCSFLGIFTELGKWLRRLRAMFRRGALHEAASRDCEFRQGHFLSTRSHRRLFELRPDVGAAAPASLTGKLRFQIRQPDIVGPAIGVDNDRMGATTVGAIIV